MSKKRLLILALGIFSLFALLIAQFYRIQVIEGDKWTKVAERQHFFIVKEPFLRGGFFSNTSIKKGHPEKPQRFVTDIQKYHLYADPVSIAPEYRDAIADQLMRFLDASLDEQMSLRKELDKKSRSRKLATWISRETRDLIIQWWQPYARKRRLPANALFFVSDYQRSYPFGKLLGQVLHTIQDQKDESTMQAMPTGGLELSFNEQLKGKQGKRRLMRSPRNALETGQVITAPKNGTDIYLTINHVLQTIAEEELAKGVKKAKAASGWAVMMDPKSGEILALAQYPFFNPPEYAYYFNDPVMIEHTKVKAITDAVEPGSIMKACTIAIALLADTELKKRGEKELFTPSEKIACADGHFTGRSRPLNDTHTHRYLNMYMGFQKSSNVYMARLMERVVKRLGSEWYSRTLKEVFGFGKKVGIELPAESAGVVPTPGKKHANGTYEWSAGTPYTLAMGYNLQTTALQMVRAYALFANGGYLVQPTLVLRNKPVTFPKVLPDAVVNEVAKAMKYTTKPGGTARRGDIPGYTEAGKTSTSKKLVNGQYSDTLYHSSFIGFTPFSEPAFVLLVMLDEPEMGYLPGVGKTHHGGTCAAPIFREISRRSLEYLGISPDDPFGYPVGDPRYDPLKADWIKETRSLQEMYEKWNK